MIPYKIIVEARRRIKKEVIETMRLLYDFKQDESELNGPMKDIKFTHNICHWICKHCVHGAVWQEKPECKLNKYKECRKIINTDKCKFEEVK